MSHGHGPLAEKIVADLLACPEVARVVVIRNIPETLALPDDPRLVRIDNATARGFGANHNAAFARVQTPFFCVINPDIRLRQNPFPALLEGLRDGRAGVCSPRVLGPTGVQEDHARYFPTFASLVLKALTRHPGRHAEGTPGRLESPDWVAGMFLCFRSEAFRAVGGFDEGYYLYYEDVDLCARLRRRGSDVRLCNGATVVHDARRESRKNLRFLRWHLASLARYLWKHAGRLPARPS